jgi:hypothetical protein
MLCQFSFGLGGNGKGLLQVSGNSIVHTIANTEMHKPRQQVHQTAPQTLLFCLTNMHGSIPRIGEVTEFSNELIIKENRENCPSLETDVV